MPSSNEHDLDASVTLVGALGSSSAEWFCVPPAWSEVEERPAFDGKAVGLRAIRGAPVVAALRSLRHLGITLRLLRGRIGVRSTAAFLVWLDSAQAFGLTSVVVRDAKGG